MVNFLTERTMKNNKIKNFWRKIWKVRCWEMALVQRNFLVKLIKLRFEITLVCKHLELVITQTKCSPHGIQMIHRVINNIQIHFYDCVTIRPPVTTPCCWTGSWRYLLHLSQFYDNLKFSGTLKKMTKTVKSSRAKWNEIALQLSKQPELNSFIA